MKIRNWHSSWQVMSVYQDENLTFKKLLKQFTYTEIKNKQQQKLYRKTLEKEMATHSSILALKTPWREVSMVSQRVRHN